MKLENIIIKVQVWLYHVITSKRIPDIYWHDEYFVIRTGPVVSAKVVFE